MSTLARILLHCVASASVQRSTLSPVLPSCYTQREWVPGLGWPEHACLRARVRRSLIDPEGGMKDIRDLDGISFTEWFTKQGGSMQSIKRMWDPIGELHACMTGGRRGRVC